jgi:hypothetical protein
LTLGLAALLGLAAVVGAAVAPLPPGPREIVYVVPRGTATRQAAGQRLDLLPSRLRFTVGDVLVLRNEDDTPHFMGFVAVPPGKTYRLPLGTPFEIESVCSLHSTGQVWIEVAPLPRPGWDRLAWRVRQLLGP